MSKTTTNDQMDRSFLSADIKDVVSKMSLEEKISLFAGKDWWTTVPIPRLNVPSVKVSDGPNGARGESFYYMCPASVLPNATCIGASFSKELAETSGAFLAEECKARNAVCLLAPTINIQRSPLGGRAFESYSEDPTLSGLTAAAYINGLQKNGVSATIKHFVGNDQEHERMGEDSIIGQRALREVYLKPFQLAQKHSKPWAYMTSYNKLNGTHCSENQWLLQTLLRKEWGHDGLIMSDWFGTYSVADSINAGLDMEMPGEALWHGHRLVAHLVSSHKIDIRRINKSATEVLQWVQKLAKLNEDLVYAPPSAEKTRTEAKEADAKLIRRLGAEGIVLLKNEGDILPIRKGKVAVIGPNAKVRVISGGGSALLRAAWSVTPFEGLEANKPSDVELSYTLGASTSKYMPIFDESFTCLDGSPGFDILHFPIEDGAQASKPAVTETRDSSDMFMGDFNHPALGKVFFTEVKAVFTSPLDGEYEFGLAVTGQGWLYVDEKLVIDNSKDQVRGEAFFGNGTTEVKGIYKVEKGKKYNIRVLHDGRSPAVSASGETSPFQVNGIRIGAFENFDADKAIDEAVSLAKSIDIPIIVAGLTADWESEGYDRAKLSLPLRSNELIEKVAASNPNTIVVIQGGSAVSMPWIDKVKGVVYAWYGGNETGNSIADIIYGAVNPSGRLPISFPKREMDIAAGLNYKSARTKVYYEEGIWVGYKHHNARGVEPLFPFGHGLSYTTFEYSDLQITSPPKGDVGPDEFKVGLKVTVKNTGKIAGDHSVHFYTCPPVEKSTGFRHPAQQLAAFEKVYALKAGESKTVEVTLDKYAVSHWDEGYNTWRAELGEWTVKVGVDAQTMSGKATFKIDSDMEWVGL